jgi:hypothetical protein
MDFNVKNKIKFLNHPMKEVFGKIFSGKADPTGRQIRQRHESGNDQQENNSAMSMIGQKVVNGFE